jgi:hypothetical protein
MAPLAYFGINSSGVNLAINLLILFLVVMYLALIYWTYADARRRIEDPMLIGCATAASLFPFAGTLVYMILRPPEYLEDVRERELEMQAAEARLHSLDYSLCPHCDYEIERDFVRCPSCLRKLKERCISCSRPLDQAWTICPYCETEVPGAIAPRRTRRRREAEQDVLPGEGQTVAARSVADRAGAGERGARAAEGPADAARPTRASGEPAARPAPAASRPAPASPRPAPAGRRPSPRGTTP